VVAALMEARAAGSIGGIHGRLGDLGAVDSCYDVAASTAVPALDYIVVDTTSTAQRCVELLRQRQLGVATFLILEKQQHLAPALREKVSPPEGVPRLFDLVRARDEPARLAFYFAMRDTLVAADLEQAARIAYSGDRRWRRVVTTAGEMINESGTMSGGGGKPRGGRMCLGASVPKAAAVVDAREAAAELKNAEAELAAAAAALAQARAAAAEATAEAKHADKSLAALETSIPKMLMEAEAAAAKAQDLKERMAELEAATKVRRHPAQPCAHTRGCRGSLHLDRAAPSCRLCQGLIHFPIPCTCASSAAFSRRHPAPQVVGHGSRCRGAGAGGAARQERGPDNARHAAGALH
jgi:structural maintenance of chromosome 4